MNNNNIVKIGTALKWRNTFDITKKYYQENIVTVCGCVFRCKVLQAQGKTPIRATDDQGHIVYTNTDVWDVLVDMAYYYNFAVDTKKLTKDTLDYVKRLDEAFQKQQKEIQALQKDNEDQWDAIHDIENVNAEQQREIDSILDTISCFSEGIWIDTLLWSNYTIWDNNKYAITDDLQDQINVLTGTHRQDIEDLTEKHNQEISSLAAHIAKQEKIQSDINVYLQDQVYDLNSALSCFSSGIWENDLHWSNTSIWDNNKYALTDALTERIDNLNQTHKNDVEAVNQHLNNSDKAFSDAVLQNTKEHNAINSRLVKHKEAIDALQTLIDKHDIQITELLDALSCFGNGQWDNELKWSNNTHWENSNLMCDTFEDIYLQIERYQKAISDLTSKIQEVKNEANRTLTIINNTFDGFRKEHESFRTEHEAFRNEHSAIESRLNSLSSLCTEQQREINTLLYRVSVLTNGVWDNTLLWINDSEWLNVNESSGCHCPYNTKEQLDTLREGLDTANQNVEVNQADIRVCKADIEDLFAKVESNTSDIADNSTQIETAKQDSITEHRKIAYQLRAIGREQTSQDENIAKLGEHFSCFVDGLWGDLFVWDNELLWANETGVIDEALDDIRNDIRNNRQKLNEANEDIMTNLSLIRANHQLIEANIENVNNNKTAIENTQLQLDNDVKALRNEALTEHKQVAYQLRAIGREQTSQDDNIAKLGEHFGCFVDGLWGDLFVWDNEHLWANDPGIVAEVQDEVSAHDVRLSVLETALAGLMQQFDLQKNIIQQQQEQLQALMNCFSVTNIGKWQNPLFWDNDTKWADSLITELLGIGGATSVSVKSYDEKTATVSI